LTKNERIHFSDHPDLLNHDDLDKFEQFLLKLGDGTLGTDADTVELQLAYTLTTWHRVHKHFHLVSPVRVNIDPSPHVTQQNISGV